MTDRTNKDVVPQFEPGADGSDGTIGEHGVDPGGATVTVG